MFPDGARLSSYTDCSLWKHVFSLQEHTHVPKKTSNSQQNSTSTFCLQLSRISLLDYSISCAVTIKIPWGNVVVCAFPYQSAFLWSAKCQAWRIAEGVCSVPWSHCPSTKKNGQVEGLSLLRRNLHIYLSNPVSRFMLKEIWSSLALLWRTGDRFSLWTLC